MSKIIYADKVALNENPEIPEINKITYNNMNNIKKSINQSTNYNITTEVSAGKIKCNLAGTLESGDIIPISIPTLVNASATMQFSADNGAHYYTIKQMSADAVFTDYANTELSSGKYVLYFDGTNLILDKSRFGGKIETNVNTIARNGSYTALRTATGVPNTSYSWFIEHRNSNTGTASASQTATAYSTDIIKYERTKISGTWGNWINRSTVNNLTTASAGRGVLDANQGKVLDDKITNLKTYSTSEVDTGQIWIDGKHIYRKTITGIPSASYSLRTLNIDAIVIFDFKIVRANGGIIPNGYYYSDNNYLTAEMPDKTSITMYGPYITSSYTFITILEYTKTS